MFNKLQTKILLILFVALSITLGTNYFIGDQMLKSEMFQAVTAEAFATAKGLKVQVERLISYGIPLEDLTGFNEICEEAVRKDTDVKYAIVVDTNGDILFHSGAGRESIEKEPKLLEALKEEKETLVNYMFGDEEYFGFILPVFNLNRQYVGSVILEYPKVKILKPINSLSFFTFVVAFIMFSIAMFLNASALSFWVTKPLLKLYKATREIFYNGTEAINMVEVTTNDEIGRLSESFNLMLERLKKTTVSKTYVDNIISSMTDALIVIGIDKKIETVNEAAIDLLRYGKDELIHKPIDIIFDETGETPFKGEWLENLKENDQNRNFETKFITKDGAVIPILLCYSAMKTQEKGVIRIVCTARDITEIKKAEEIMFRQANFDMLTGMPNRSYLESQMAGIINDEHNCGQHTFLSLDLDKFKIVNDVCGHHAGDQFMKHISLIMKQSLKDKDILARLGGDEFGAFLPNTSISEGCEVAERLCKLVKDFHFTWKEKLFTFGVSIGAVEINKDIKDIEWILSAADRACYVSKEKGGNRVHVFSNKDKELNEREEEMHVMPDIVKAFEGDSFTLKYQPIIPVNFDENNKKYEVLIRMVDENGSLVIPNAFLPAALRYNMMPVIDRWVIHNFLSNYKKEISVFVNRDTVFSINISGASLNTASFMDYVCEEIEKYEVPPHALCFEITETSAVSNFVDASNFINKLREMGCKFALDDFGSGISSFTYLKHLPVDYIKIEGEFIKNIASSRIDSAMVSSINEMAHVMGMKTIAEYVENEEIYKCIKEIGIDYMQGFWLGKPGDLREELHFKVKSEMIVQ